MKEMMTQHLVTCGLIELTGAVINLIYKNYIAWWALLGATIITIILGIWLIKRTKDESTR